MGRAPCCDKATVKRGPWSPEEDAKLKEFIEIHGTGGNWIALPQKADLKRCGKSCRLRWLNYLRPNIKHGEFSDDEDRMICSLYASIGSRWSVIAAQLPGRTENDIKNYWNTKLKKKLMGLINHNAQRKPQQAAHFSSLLHTTPLPSSPSTPLSSSPSCSNTSYNYTLAGSFTEPISFSSCPLSNNSFSTASIQETFVGSMRNYHVKDSLMRFGGEASCSSSDGSCSNQMSHVKEEYEHGGGANNNTEQVGLQNYLHNGAEDDQKLMVSSGGAGHGVLDVWKQIVYGLEEIKQHISTSYCNNFLFDENKTADKVMYY